MKISVVIPVYNEPLNIKPTINNILKCIKNKFEIIIVYDEDNDTTLPVINKNYGSLKNIRAVKNQISKGASGAIRTGFLFAKGDWIIVTMADLCDQFEQSISLIENKANPAADIYSFSRFMTKSEIKITDVTFKLNKTYLKHLLKIILPKIASFILQKIGGLPITDPTNSFKIYKSELINSLNLKSVISFSVTFEVVMKAFLLDKKMFEISTKWEDRKFGVSNFPLISSIKAYLPWFFLMRFKNNLFSFSNKYKKKVARK